MSTPTFTEEDLTSPLTAKLYTKYPYNVQELIAARVAYVTKPTPAIQINIFPYDPRRNSTQPIDPNSLSTFEEALDIYQKLVKLGLPPSVDIYDDFVPNAYQYVDWGSEIRRFWNVGPYRVGKVILDYAKNPSWVVDSKLRESFVSNKLLS